jgi:hypothetical protein
VNTLSITIVADEDPVSRARLREAVARVMAEACIAEAESLDALEDALLTNPDNHLILVDACVVDISGALHASAAAVIRVQRQADTDSELRRLSGQVTELGADQCHVGQVDLAIGGVGSGRRNDCRRQTGN